MVSPSSGVSPLIRCLHPCSCPAQDAYFGPSDPFRFRASFLNHCPPFEQRALQVWNPEDWKRDNTESRPHAPGWVGQALKWTHCDLKAFIDIPQVSVCVYMHVCYTHKSTSILRVQLKEFHTVNIPMFLVSRSRSNSTRTHNPSMAPF